MKFATLFCFVLLSYGSIDALDIPEQLQKLLKIQKPAEEAPYELPALDFGYDSLEPFIDAETVQIHHRGHHAGYTKKMNAILKQWSDKGENEDLLAQPIVDILKNGNEIPIEFRENLQNQGGGFINHAWYWATLSPLDDSTAERKPIGTVAAAIEQRYGKFELFQKEFTETASKFFGSGYVWLCQVAPSNVLQVITFPNQMTPFAFDLKPILVLDVWEHAYYLKHQNRRSNHIDDWWHVVDWKKVEDVARAWNDEGAKSKDEL